MAVTMTKAPTRRAQEQKYMSTYGKVEPAVVPAPTPPKPVLVRFKYEPINVWRTRFYTRVTDAEINFINGKEMATDEVDQYIHVRRNYDHSYQRAYENAIKSAKEARDQTAIALAFAKELAEKWAPYQLSDKEVMEFVTHANPGYTVGPVAAVDNKNRTICSCCGSRNVALYTAVPSAPSGDERAYQVGHDRFVKAIWFQTVGEGETVLERLKNPESLTLWDEETKSSFILNWVYNQ